MSTSESTVIAHPASRKNPIAQPDSCVPSSFLTAARLQRSVTAAIERRCLDWLVLRVPTRIHSDHLTLLGLASMVLAGASYAWARWNKTGLICATVFLALNWLGDSLDGSLARFRNCQRPRYGFYVDHMIDMFGSFFLMGGLALSGFVDWRVALGMLIAFLMLSIEVYLATYTLGVFHLSFAGLGPTEIRILLALGNMALLVHPTILDSRYRLFDVGGAVAIAGMASMLVIASVRHTRALYNQEPDTSRQTRQHCPSPGQAGIQ